MKVTILGTNGLLSTSLGCYYSKCECELNMYGLSEPQKHSYFSFTKVNLLSDSLDYASLRDSDIIIYSVGAGVQSNSNECSNIIYGLNVELPIKICNGLREVDYKGVFITFGSYFEIGANTENRKYTELELLNSQLDVPNDYAVSKRMLSRFVSSFNGTFKLYHFILPTIYGENEAEHRLIPYVLKSIKNHTKLSFTSGEQVRQYIYIDEIPEIITKVFEANLEGGIYNIAGAESFSVKELVYLLFKLMGETVPSDVFGTTNRKDEGMKILALDGGKLNSRLKYKSSVSICDVYMKYLLTN